MAINNNAPENSTLPARDRNKRKKEKGVLKNKKKDSACLPLEKANFQSLKRLTAPHPEPANQEVAGSCGKHFKRPTKAYHRSSWTDPCLG